MSSYVCWLELHIHGCTKTNVLYKNNVAYITNKQWGVRNEMRCKKIMDNNWAPRKKNGVK